MAPFAVVEPAESEAFSSLEKQGFKKFRFVGHGVATVNFPRGFIANEFAHLPLVVWALRPAHAAAAALTQLKKMSPAYRWTVADAPKQKDARE